MSNEPADEPTKADLTARATALGVPTSGTKADIAERIAEEAKKTEKEPFFAGFYAGGDLAVYACPHCFFTYRSSAEVASHIQSGHPDKGGND